MDDIELMVVETFKHLEEHFVRVSDGASYDESVSGLQYVSQIPNGAGLIYHIQESESLFVIRTLVSRNIRKDFNDILLNPDLYPSLRLSHDGSTDIKKKIRFFILENYHQAEIIHDQISNRRFPFHEELVCNLSDPAFSWWLTKKPYELEIAFTLSMNETSLSKKLGPIGDQQLAVKNFQLFQRVLDEAGLRLSVQNEIGKVQILCQEDLLFEEFIDLFELGVMGGALAGFFKLLSKRIKDQSLLETLWIYFQEIAAMRRFWIQIQFDLDKTQC